MNIAGYFQSISLAAVMLIYGLPVRAQELKYDSLPVSLEIRESGAGSVRITLMPSGTESELPDYPMLGDKDYPSPVLSINEVPEQAVTFVGRFTISVNADPFKVFVRDRDGMLIQELTFGDDGRVYFKIDESPILGMGEGGPRMGRGWRDEEIEFDRRGRLHKMEPRWQANAYGSRNPVAMLAGTGGWGLFVVSPWVQVDLSGEDQGVFIPLRTLGLQPGVQNKENQQQNSGKGIPPPGTDSRGQFDIFVFDTEKPESFLDDLAEISGRAVLPPKWALGYMQSHRTLQDDSLMTGIVKTFREKKIPLDAVIYLGTGFCPRGWNTEQPSFDFNPEVFHRKASEVIDDLHDLHVKVVVHMVPWDRDKLPTLDGTIPTVAGEKLDESHILNYWKQHTDLVESGIDAWWPDEGDWFDLYERIKRHQMYYQGPLFTTPDVRPWSLHRNGHLGIAQWGGWVWSGDTESAWKTLEGQIAVGINHSLSLSPFWGSDIGGFYPNEELDGELYARWFQFGAFCPSFRSHGRTWWTRLPWGWGLSEGLWYDWWDNKEYEGGKFITRYVDLTIMPLFTKAGAIIPFDPLRQFTSQPVDEPLEIRIYAGADGSYTLYEDDGISLDYLDDRNINLTRFEWEDDTRTLTIEPVDNEDNKIERNREFMIVMLPSGKQKLVNYRERFLKLVF